jgi:hypothetical protein
MSKYPYLCSDLLYEIEQYLTTEEIIANNLWRIFINKRNCSSDDLYFAAKYGRINMFKYLYKTCKININRIDEDSILITAAENGQLKMLKWIDKNLHFEKWTNALNWATITGRLNIVKWLVKHKPELKCVYLSLDFAAASGHYKTIKYIYDCGRGKCSYLGIDFAAKYSKTPSDNYFRIIKYLCKHEKEGYSRLAINNATEKGNIHVVEFLNTKYPHLLRQ